MFPRRSGGVPVRIARRNVECVQDPGAIQQPGRGRNRRRKFLQQSAHDMTPSFLFEPKVERLDGHFPRLLRRKTGPLMPTRSRALPRVLKITLRLRQPISGSVRHDKIVSPAPSPANTQEKGPVVETTGPWNFLIPSGR